MVWKLCALDFISPKQKIVKRVYEKKWTQNSYIIKERERGRDYLFIYLNICLQFEIVIKISLLLRENWSIYRWKLLDRKKT